MTIAGWDPSWKPRVPVVRQRLRPKGEHYTIEVKRGVIKERDSGKSWGQISRETGIRESTIRAWVAARDKSDRMRRPSGGHGGNHRALRDEARRRGR